MKHGESGVLQIVDMTGEKLLRTLEYAIPADNDIRGWFYYFSGLKMTYAPSAIQKANHHYFFSIYNYPFQNHLSKFWQHLCKSWLQCQFYHLFRTKSF